MAKPKQSRKSTPTPPPKPAAVSAEKPLDALQLHAELDQLAVIRAKFPALADAHARGMLARHSDEACRARGGSTRASATFRGGMNWARTIGAHPTDAAFSPRRTRWYLDCLTALGSELAGTPVLVTPSALSAYDDARSAAERRVRQVLRDLRRAAGQRADWLQQIDAAQAAVGAGEPVLAVLEALAVFIEQRTTDADRAVLEIFDLDATTVTALRAAAATLRDQIRERGAPGLLLASFDAPRVNIAEGRLFFAMRDLWDDAAAARAASTSLITLTVSPTLLRGLGLNRTSKSTAEPSQDPRRPDAPVA
jgi:hypothetical protein